MQRCETKSPHLALALHLPAAGTRRVTESLSRCKLSHLQIQAPFSFTDYRSVARIFAGLSPNRSRCTSYLRKKESSQAAPGSDGHWGRGRRGRKGGMGQRRPEAGAPCPLPPLPPRAFKRAAEAAAPAPTPALYYSPRGLQRSFPLLLAGHTLAPAQCNVSGLRQPL